MVKPIDINSAKFGANVRPTTIDPSAVRRSGSGTADKALNILHGANPKDNYTASNSSGAANANVGRVLAQPSAYTGPLAPVRTDSKSALQALTGLLGQATRSGLGPSINID